MSTLMKWRNVRNHTEIVLGTMGAFFCAGYWCVVWVNNFCSCTRVASALPLRAYGAARSTCLVKSPGYWPSLSHAKVTVCHTLSAEQARIGTSADLALAPAGPPAAVPCLIGTGFAR